ncbi:hypothetical protein SNE26_20710 [Mucilaginibacter sp. cycad4]|uniref:hypothetical protein n=1 Tax=Mucilaginibacter sp. cycad4 TaxID=3342096 RepID=UPI002AAB3A8C|nr:hypothetical protein [Mucilaginibacter gossypii]WPU98450.1 hypothetical protein SNE26_20710 [Mucilaginibacter gossypii]
MKEIKKLAIVPLLSGMLLLSLSGVAQTIGQISDSFNKYGQTIVQEKIFVHTDKSAYITGEILWFKVYNVDATYHKPLGLSKVVYVDVLDSKQNAIIQTKIEMKNGLGNGSVYIPVSASNGNYKLRAYTNWMKNFSPDYYFEKAITIVNPLKSPETQVKALPSDYDVQFFPEGGNLVAGINSKVAFKVTAPDGRGLSEYRGFIIDQKHDTVARFRPLKFGIGSFLFTPTGGNIYTAVIKSSGTPPVTKDLPAVNSRGYVMAVKDLGSTQVEITVKGAGFEAGELYLFAHTKQSVKLAMTASFNSGTASFILDKAKLGEGISHLTIFNSARQPVCERLYFKRPKQNLIIEATADQASYAHRRKVSVDIVAKDFLGQVKSANLSMSVYKIDSLQNIDAGEIFSYLWLKSDLRGNIESPGYYLKDADAEADTALDNLMLTQGWRRFQWDNVLSSKTAAFSFFPEYDGHLVTGKITNTRTGGVAKDIVAYLSVPGKRVQLYAAKSDSAGRLVFNTRQLYGPGEIVVQTNSERDTAYHIDILSPFSEQYSKYPVSEFNLTGGMQNAIEEGSLGMQVQNIYLSNKIKHFYEPQVDSSGFYVSPYKTYLLDNYTRFTTMEEVLREYVREVWVNRSQKRYHIKVLNDNGFLDGDPLVMLDDVPVFNIDKVMAIDPLKVRKLEDVPYRYYWGPSVYEGILSFTTYKGDLGGVEIDPRAVVLDYEGLQLQREFYSPVYDTEQTAKSRVPDFRNLLFWAPDINTSAPGKKQLSFYTSDQTGKYIGIVQGITAQGDAASQYFNFKVR